jgi:hypothetical protein
VEAIIKIVEENGKIYLLRVKEHATENSYWESIKVLEGGNDFPLYVKKVCKKVINTYTPEKYPEYFI